MPEHSTDALFLFTFVFKQALTLFHTFPIKLYPIKSLLKLLNLDNITFIAF